MIELKGAEDRIAEYEFSEKMLKRELESRDERLRRLERDLNRLRFSCDLKDRE